MRREWAAALAATMLSTVTAGTQADAAPVLQAADVPVLLKPGEAVALAPAEAGFEAIDRGAAVLTALDRAAASQIAQEPIPDAPVPLGKPLTVPGLEPDAIAPGRVTAKMFALPNGATMLVIENGLDRAVRYHAAIMRDGQLRPTDVCLVPAGKRSFEYWPHDMDGLQLDRFEPVAYDGGTVPCE